MKKVEICRYEKGVKGSITDLVVSEKTLNIFVNDKYLDSITYSNDSEKELVVGYLFLENFVNDISDIKEMYFEYSEYSTNCYLSIIKSKENCRFAKTPIEGKVLFGLMRDLLAKGETFRKTGGTHISGVAEPSLLIAYYEDVSRKSTIQKCSGYLLLQEKPASILLTSGRVFLYTVKYAYKIGIPYIVSQSAPSDLAVIEAQEKGITLIGFLRDNRFNIYSHVKDIL